MKLLRALGACTGLLVFSLMLFTRAMAQDIPPRPDPPKLVNDLANILGQQETASLEAELVAFNDSTSNQIVVLTIPSLKGYDPAQFAYEVGEQWGVGQKGFNNGVVILVKPKTADEKGEVFIAVGYGLEPVIPDATGKLIVENEMIPRFRQDDYPGGIRAAVKIIKGLASGEFKSSDYAPKEGKPAWVALIPVIIIFLIFIIIRSNRNNSNNIGSKGMSFWTWLMMMNAMGNRGGNWGDFRSGSGDFGGFGGGGGGGGFGGFGGGGFGGGGAGGSW